jgi:hypothetical protein
MRNLTLNDDTQRTLMGHLATTERLLARAATEAGGRPANAEIVLLPDLGMPHNVTRARGGFFTGAYYSWTSGCPFVPIDATVNVDTVSIYRVRPIESAKDFEDRVRAAEAAVRRGRGRSTAGPYTWNFDVGNHFITYGVASEAVGLSAGAYLVLHSSASEFKNQHGGLYPTEGNWYWDDVKAIRDPSTGRYLRYICGQAARDFINGAQALVEYNWRRHHFVAAQVMGRAGVLDELFSVPHYGMPTHESVAIGCQWAVTGQMLPLLTGPNRPVFVIRAEAGGNNAVKVGNATALLYPHGLGKQSMRPLALDWADAELEVNGRRVSPDASLEDDPTLELRDFFAGRPLDIIPPEIEAITRLCPATIVGRIDPVYSYARSMARPMDRT